MVNSSETIVLQSYLEDFMKSLKNFLSKSPLTTRPTFVQGTGTLYIEVLNNKGVSIDGISFTINPLMDKQSQIKQIKDKLEILYPIIKQEKFVPLTTKEIEDEMANFGTSLEDALKMRNKVYVNRYKIIRVHHRYNEFDCLELSTNELVKYKLKYKENYSITTATFLNKLEDNPTSMSKLFFDAFEYKYKL